MEYDYTDIVKLEYFLIKHIIFLYNTDNLLVEFEFESHFVIVLTGFNLRHYKNNTKSSPKEKLVFIIFFYSSYFKAILNRKFIYILL